MLDDTYRDRAHAPYRFMRVAFSPRATGRGGLSHSLYAIGIACVRQRSLVGLIENLTSFDAAANGSATATHTKIISLFKLLGARKEKSYTRSGIERTR